MIASHIFLWLGLDWMAWIGLDDLRIEKGFLKSAIKIFLACCLSLMFIIDAYH